MRVFVTGATGFAGSYLVDSLLSKNYEVTCLVHSSSSHQTVPNHPFCKAYNGDLLDLDGLKGAVLETRPDIIYHLAGMAATAGSWGHPALTLQINTIGTANILEAALAADRPRVVVVTSADIYGIIRPETLPISEQTPAQPRHPYGVSKWAASELVRLYWERYQLPVIEARPFNHIGPRQTRGFVVPDFASQLAAIKLGQQAPTMAVGNLSARRDFTDVQDMVRAYELIAQKGQAGQSYLICSGRAVSIQHILDTLLDLVGIDVTVTQDPLRMRPSDTPIIYGSYTRLQQDTGWEPQIPLRESLTHILTDWLDKLKNTA